GSRPPAAERPCSTGPRWRRRRRRMECATLGWAWDWLPSQGGKPCASPPRGPACAGVRCTLARARRDWQREAGRSGRDGRGLGRLSRHRPSKHPRARGDKFRNNRLSGAWRKLGRQPALKFAVLTVTLAVLEEDFRRVLAAILQAPRDADRLLVLV